MVDKKEINNKKEFIDIVILKKIIDIFEKKSLSELEIESSGIKLKLKKAPVTVLPSNTIPQKTEEEIKSNDEKDTDNEKNYHTVKSPIVGTFYNAPSPNEETYIKVGDFVEKGQILCIIEAMKIMNEIESDSKGRIVSILVDNGHPVEYDEPLFLIEPL